MKLARDFLQGTLLVVILAGHFGRVSAGEPEDLQSYVDQIRNWGMTESARQALRSASGFRLGYSLLTVRRNPEDGSAGALHQSATCPLPDADPEQVMAWQSQVQESIDRDIELLRAFADADASGFVSTQEGLTFRQLIEFGYLAEDVRLKHDSDQNILTKVTYVAVDSLSSRANRYNRMATTLNAKSGVAMPLIGWLRPTAGDQ